MPRAARIGDTETCGHGSGAIVTGSATVIIEGRLAARVGDKLNCGGSTQIESGSPTVIVDGSRAARVTDTSCHGGRIATGAATVIIGNGGGSRSTTLDRAHGKAAPFVRG